MLISPHGMVEYMTFKPPQSYALLWRGVIEAIGSCGGLKGKPTLSRHSRKQGSFGHLAYAPRCGTSQLRPRLQVNSQMQSSIFAA